MIVTARAPKRIRKPTKAGPKLSRVIVGKPATGAETPEAHQARGDAADRLVAGDGRQRDRKSPRPGGGEGEFAVGVGQKRTKSPSPDRSLVATWPPRLVRSFILTIDAVQALVPAAADQANRCCIGPGSRAPAAEGSRRPDWTEPPASPRRSRAPLRAGGGPDAAVAVTPGPRSCAGARRRGRAARWSAWSFKVSFRISCWPSRELLSRRQHFCDRRPMTRELMRRREERRTPPSTNGFATDQAEADYPDAE